ncbi:MAG: response regulator [Ignavibacteriae bacterium]|nr:response regulator [Ignavibacteria bacterium]MBI3364926.1 response regulator [Ignavibacteriota bacterium]
MSEKVRILVAEDDTQLRESLDHHLSEQGYDVTSASDGNEAIPLIHGREFHLVILDLKMPYIDGFEILKFIKSTFPNTKVIVLTAYADLMTTERCKSLNADEVIGKPYNVQDLFDVIEGMMKK